ncbi:52 kDa repressor of the inhibitor of the protein kinase-like isoform X1 [Centruroides sculpturatus]|uniref:52 kDa repressor of the inhibitor of the protein kinase-like isoform X1 n=1 Tax=Centruroides sculpturatus TaxID=218467 RepID=UPI000C6DF2F7|nr:52 kDa repressor of the inhibitor of the protein kinase-like isoform X1 [Centruroides sculpturatus]
MVGCSAPNCKNSTEKGVRLFRFPADKARKAKWGQYCRREKWKPTESSRLCEIHFEESQFELKRADGRKLLKWNAIPTLFDLPNFTPRLPLREAPREREPPPNECSFALSSVNCNEAEESAAVDTNDSHNEKEAEAEESAAVVANDSRNEKLAAENKMLKREIRRLMERQEALERKLSKFLKPDQVQYMQRVSKSNPYPWTNETIRHALQLKCAVGNRGYEYLRQIEYPLPSSRTINRRIKSCRFNSSNLLKTLLSS